MQAGESETFLWWLMIVTGCAAAGLSLYTTRLARAPEDAALAKWRYRLNITSYVLMSASILCFVARGLMLPQ